MASEVQICNLALQKLGARAITSLTDGSVEARECNRVYEHLRDVEIRAHPWAFAKKRVQLAASSTSPAFGPANAYPLPSDYLMLHWDIFDLASSDGIMPRDWTIENHENERAIVTDDAAPLKVVYIARITDVNTMDTLFRETLATRMALVMAEKLTQSNSKRQLGMDDYRNVVSQARRAGAIETRPIDSEQDDWITARL